MPLIRRQTCRRHGGKTKVKKRMMELLVSLGAVSAAAAQSAAPPVMAEPAQAALPRQAVRPLMSEPVRVGHLPPCTLVSGVKPEPCRLAPPRRAVPQIIERMPVPPQRGHGAQPQPAAPSTFAPPAIPGAPRPLAGCVGGACRDAAGVLYDGGVGNATLDPNGRLCNRDGAWLQCF